MGWHFILECTAKMKPDYIAFLQEHKEILLYKEYDYMMEEKLSPADWKRYHEWHRIPVNGSYYKFIISDDILTFCIMKRPYYNHRYPNTMEDYMSFMRLVIAKYAIHISECTIEDDGINDGTDYYTDQDVRDFLIHNDYHDMLEDPVHV
jgi:hypothetical protein